MKMLKSTLYRITAITVIILFSMPSAYSLNISTGSRLIYPEYSKRISMDFKNAQLNDVLKIFSQQSNLNFIASQEVADKKVTLYLDEVPVEEALERILNANDLRYEMQPGSDIFIVKELEKPSKELITKVYSLKHATVDSSKIKDTLQFSESSSTSGPSKGESGDGIIAAVKAMLTPDGSIVQDPRTNSVIVTDIATQFPLIEQTIARLDVPVPQIVIEVEMLDISKATADQIGVKYGATPLTFSGAKRYHVYPWDQNKLLTKGYTFEDGEYVSGTIDASGATMMLQFLRAQTDTKYLARPRLLTLNNETAEIKISTNEAIGIQTQTNATEGTSTQSVEAERVETGVFLTVTPQANAETGEIVLAVAPKVIQARTGGTFDGKTFKDPEERGAQVLLKVQDGKTIMLGGLLRENKSETVTKLPVLGDLPLIGGAFRHKDSSIDERELIIFMTPHIVTQKNIASKIEKFRKISREQDIPETRFLEVQKALAIYEKHKL